MKADWRETNRKFNIPFNFSNELIVGMQLLKVATPEINCLYFRPYQSDAVIVRKRDIADYEYDLDRDFYFERLTQVNKQFPNKLQLLLNYNQPIDVMEGNLLQEYLDIGVKKFCVGTLEQAKAIKEVMSDADISGSIVMHMTNEKLQQNKENYIKYFNNFVLDFQYSRDIDLIKELPKDFTYTLIVNSLCDIRCNKADSHWFEGIEYPLFEDKCPYLDLEDFDFEHSTYIRPMDLEIFDEYIDSYELIERDWPADRILRDIVLYTSRYDKKIIPNLNINENLYKKEKG